MKKLVSIRRIIEAAEEDGEDLDSLFIDRDDIVEVEESETAEE